MSKNKKCECGEPIFRDDRDCCDSCYNTGITPQDELHMVIEYYSYNAHPRPEGVIGLSMDDIEYVKEVKEWCCLDMKEKWKKEVGFSGYDEVAVIQYYTPREKNGIRDLEKIGFQEMIYPSGKKLNKCPYCHRPIIIKHRDKDELIINGRKTRIIR